jgi:membrane protein implicated in regulation of membrane protease activity
VIKVVEGKRMVSIEGDLWPVDGGEDLEPGAKVRVLAQESGAVRVERAAPMEE